MLRLASRTASLSAPAARRALCAFPITDRFVDRHMGPSEADVATMLDTVGYASLDALVDATIPGAIRLPGRMDLPAARSEVEALAEFKEMMSENQVMTSLIGMGYYETTTPGVILRNMLENPGWYTSYTPYQAEISQGRLEMLLNFQTMVADLTGHDIAGASLLDEGTAAAEALAMCVNTVKKRNAVWVMDDVLPQTLAVVRTRCSAIGVDVRVGSHDDFLAAVGAGELSGVLVQYPGTDGVVRDYEALVGAAHGAKTMVVAATDLLALTKLRPPGEMGVDISVGSAQRFGVPMGFGGPHAAFIATSDKHKRKMPGRVIGVSVDSRGKPALRMAMQTREQHIRRDKATSNICTAQALLANMAAAYGVYHGPQGVTAIADRVHAMAEALRAAVGGNAGAMFDTFTVDVADADATMAKAVAAGFNLRRVSDMRVGVSLGESVTSAQLDELAQVFGAPAGAVVPVESSLAGSGLERTSSFMTHEVFNSHHSETQMLRYLKTLENRDLSLAHSMISLGSCTMKLNATSEMIPVTWPEVCSLHPFVPNEQAQGYHKMMGQFDDALRQITGFTGVSHQPNSGAQGEFAGLMCIRDYHQQQGDAHRTVCLVPISAHGTNPASAVMAGMRVVTVQSDDEGNVDLADLRAKAEEHADNLGALMITYPSTYGVFEEGVREAIDIVHSNGGLVYMDGANMNAQVGFCSPGHIGADVCHLNLHKTFCIPHGGGGPGVGTICCNDKLKPFLPSPGGAGQAVSAAPYGSAAILPISFMYVKMLGAEGLERSTQLAILGANYMAERLGAEYDILYSNANGRCAHEFIIDLRSFKADGIVEEDVAKRLQDFGFHSPTMSWPVPGTLMVEPTESEDKAELDRFCDAMLAIREEIRDVQEGRVAAEDSPLKHAPHTIDVVAGDSWDRAYSRDQAAYPAPWLRRNKFWPSVGRVDNVHGDRNLVCSCPPLSAYED